MMLLLDSFCFFLLAHAANEVLLYENLEKLGANALSRDNETELGESS